MREYDVVVAAGSLRDDEAPVQFDHSWTDGGVSYRGPFTGAHLLHLAAAGCVLNDLYREAKLLEVPLDGVRVTSWGGFDTTNWSSRGVSYEVELDSTAASDDLALVLERVDAVAEIPRALRQGMTVVRAPGA